MGDTLVEDTAVSATRTLVVHCPDWPVVAAGAGGEDRVIVVRANRVVAASSAARSLGITTGLRRRQAQRMCPSVVVVDHRPDRDARAFEPVASALDAISSGVEITRPGTVAFTASGPSRYFGGDEAMAERTSWVVTGATGGSVAVGVGVADGLFTALLAARRAVNAGRPSLVVAPGGSPGFLAPLPTAALGEAGVDAELIDVLKRLGLRTLAQVADLAVTDVLARFASPGVVAHRLASGLDPRPLDARHPRADLSVSRDVDPPAEQVDRAAFVAKSLADELHESLTGNGLACTQVLVEAETDHGETLARHWRHEGALSAAALADRVRWQLDGWLSGSVGHRPTAGITRLRLVPVEVVAAKGRQLGFWGGETLIDERMVRAVARIQALVGNDAVTVPEVRGGRGPAERVARVPVVGLDLASPRPTAHDGHLAAPWPGRVPSPSPAEVIEPPLPVGVFDHAGQVVGVSGRGEVSAPPARMEVPGRGSEEVVSWSGPWPADEHWWDPDRHRRRARFQVLSSDGGAHLLAVEGGRWWLEGTYA